MRLATPYSCIHSPVPFRGGAIAFHHNVDMRQDRFGAVDRSPEFERMTVELLRQKTPAERLQMVMDRIQAARDLRKATEAQRKSLGQ